MEINVVRNENARCLKLNTATTTSVVVVVVAAVSAAHKICMQIVNYIIVPICVAPGVCECVCALAKVIQNTFNSSNSVLSAILMKVNGEAGAWRTGEVRRFVFKHVSHWLQRLYYEQQLFSLHTFRIRCLFSGVSMCCFTEFFPPHMSISSAALSNRGFFSVAALLLPPPATRQ